LSALLFLYRHVLEADFPWLDELVHPKRPKKLPVVLTRAEAQTLLSCLHGSKWLMAILLYGAGLRLLECLRRRVKDIIIERGEIVVRDGKDGKDRGRGVQSPADFPSISPPPDKGDRRPPMTADRQQPHLDKPKGTQ